MSLAESGIVPPKTSKMNDGKKDVDGKMRQSRWSLFSHTKDLVSDVVPGPDCIGRKPVDELTPEEKQKLDGYFVRIRYNEKVMKIPGCKQDGKHLEGDDNFCTLVCPFVRLMEWIDQANIDEQEAFKAIVDKFTPKNWKAECMSNLEASAFPEKPEPAGY